MLKRSTAGKATAFAQYYKLMSPGLVARTTTFYGSFKMRQTVRIQNKYETLKQ